MTFRLISSRIGSLLFIILTSFCLFPPICDAGHEAVLQTSPHSLAEITNNTRTFELEVTLDGQGPYVIGRGQTRSLFLEDTEVIGEHEIVARARVLEKYLGPLQVGKECRIVFKTTGEAKGSPAAKVHWSKVFTHEDFFPRLGGFSRGRYRKAIPDGGLEITHEEKSRYQEIWKGNYIGGLIHRASQKHRIPAALLTAIIAVESAFNANAVSHKGALGLMQLMPKTCARFNVQRPFDPQENLEGGVKYLRYLLDEWSLRFPSYRRLELSLAAYNAGERNVELHGGVPPFKETKDYVREVLKRYKYIERTLAM